MSARIQRKSLYSSQRGRQSLIVTSDDAFSYALRTAYLHYLLQPRPRRQIPVPPPQVVNRSSGTFHELIREFTPQQQDSKSARFPKDFLPLLQKRLEKVWMGRDTHLEYKDALVKRTFAGFYTQLTERRFNDQMSKSRRPEDLLLIFYSAAMKEIQKDKSQEESKPLADRHVALFVRLMHTVIREHGWSSSYPDLAHRLQNLEKKLLRHDENLAEGSQGSSGAKTMLGPPEPRSYNVNDMPMVKIVSRVFNIPLEICQEDIDRNKSVWTDRAALQDMKTYNNNLNVQNRKALRAEDFLTMDAFEAWKRTETPELSKVMLAIIQSNPEELTGASAAARRPTQPPPAPTYSVQSPYASSSLNSQSSAYSAASPTIRAVSQMDVTMSPSNGLDNDDETSYTFIPPDARGFYRHVVDRCLTYDLNDPDLIPIQPPDADPIHLLSKESMDLLDECGLRWRLPRFSRMVLLLDSVRVKYERGDSDLVTLDGAFTFFKSEISDGFENWTRADQSTYRQLLVAVHSCVLRELYEMLMHAFDPKMSGLGQVFWFLDQHILSDESFDPPDLEPFVENLQDGLRTKAEETLLGFLAEIPQNPEELDPLHVTQLTGKLTKRGATIQKRFGKVSPIFGAVDPMMTFIEVAFPRFAIEIREVILAMIEGYKAKGEELAIDDGFELYKELSEIRRIFCDAYPDRRFPVYFEEFLQDCAWRYLAAADSNVIGWVDGAVKQDLFVLPSAEPHFDVPDDKRHTSSAVDIFRSFNQPVDFLKNLGWEDEFQYAKFMTQLAKILGKGITRYCEVLEKLFTFEMDRPSAEQEVAATQTRQQKWMAMAREAWSNKDKVEPFQFAPECCVKLNNIGFAMEQFDKLEQSFNTERLAGIVNKYDPPAAHRRKTSYVFTVKIIEAEDLKAMDINGYSDPYVVLVDEYQRRLAKTRIIYSNLNPRWEETFDITTQGPILLTATLWDWDTVGDHDCLGRCSVKLDPSNFMDFLPKEFWLDLDIQGRLLLRVSMEGERDDIQFHFGKSFRMLTRTERDMTRQITDKLSAYIRHCLSKSALKSVISKGYSISSVTSLFNRSSLHNGRPQSGVNPAVVTDQEIFAAIAPLTTYFDENFAILNQTLTKKAMELVMSKLWKEVLSTLEQLMVPTLSDKPSQQKPMTPQETEVIFKWLQHLFEFFLAPDENGVAAGVPLSVLKSPKYHELQSLNYFYFEPTESLIRTSERMANAAAARQQQALQHMMGGSGPSTSLAIPGSAAKRSKSVMNKRNLGTMRQVKEEKRREAQAEPNDDMILRILRMRPEAAAYLKDRSRQKERMEASAAAEAIVRQSVNQTGGGRMAPRRHG